MAGAAEEGTAAVLRALPEPTLLALSPGGRVALANPTARALLGPAAVAEGAELAALCADEGAAAGLRAYLGRCAGSRAPLPGGAALRRADGTVARFRLSGALLSPASADGAAPARVLLRLSDAGDERFSVLSRQVRALNAELRTAARRRAAAASASGSRRHRRAGPSSSRWRTTARASTRPMRRGGGAPRGLGWCAAWCASSAVASRSSALAAARGRAAVVRFRCPAAAGPPAAGRAGGEGEGAA